MRRAMSLLLALLLLGGSAMAETGGYVSSGVAYEIFVGSFADSDGDGVGDLRGIEQKLPYLQALGVDMIWLTPIHPSPSYHHYDVTDYYDVAPEFGTLEDFEHLAAACSARGIRVILDLVVNHTSAEHPWFEEACSALKCGGRCPLPDYYNFAHEGQHAVPGSGEWFYEGQFGPHMPDLNLDSAAVRGEIREIITFWQARGAGGFRLDATTSYYSGAPGKSTEFIRFLCETARANDPDCYLVGECWADDVTILGMYASGINSLFNFPAADVEGVLVKSALSGRGDAVASRLADWNARLREISPDTEDAPFLSNHDLARARGMLRSKLPQMKAAAMLYLLLPGRPFIYYGEELGMSGSGRDENKRLPMLWSTADESANCLPPAEADQAQRLKEGVDVQERDPESLLSWYRRLVALRTLAPELTRGEMTALDGGESALCAFTVRDGGAVAVLINASEGAAVTVDLAALGLSGAKVLGSVGVEGEAFRESGSLPPVSCVLLRIF